MGNQHLAAVGGRELCRHAECGVARRGPFFTVGARRDPGSELGVTPATPNRRGRVVRRRSLESGLAQLKETDEVSGTNTYGVTDANYKNVAGETASYPYFTTTDTTPGPTHTFYQEMRSTSTTSTTTETGSYTTTAPGGPFVMPGPDNPGGYAKFSETRDDNVSVTNSATISWFARSTGSGASENVGVTYNGGAGSSVTSDKTSPAPAGAWAYTGTSTWSSSSGPSVTTAPGGIAQAQAAADSPQPAPGAANGSKAWWERDPTGILPGLVGARRGRGREWGVTQKTWSTRSSRQAARRW